MKNLITFAFLFLFVSLNAQEQLNKIETQSVTIDNLIEFIVSDFSTNKKSNITFLVETKSVKISREKIFFLKQATDLLSKRLPIKSKIALVTYNKTNGVVLKPTFADNTDLIQTRLARFKIKNNNDTFGIDLAHLYASDNFIENGTNMIIMVRDGENFEAEDMVEISGNKAVKTGAFISAIGLLPELINAIKK